MSWKWPPAPLCIQQYQSVGEGRPLAERGISVLREPAFHGLQKVKGVQRGRGQELWWHSLGPLGRDWWAGRN